MNGRSWAWCVVLVVALGAEAKEREYAFGGPPPKKVVPPPPPRFAAGSVEGLWTFLELGPFLGAGTFVDPRLYAYAGLSSTMNVGYGFEAGPVHLRPAARFSFGYEFTLPDAETGNRLLLSPVALSLAANNLLDEPRTGLRLTPAIGLTIPTSLARSTPLTTLSLALQLERRFGPVEFALRSAVGKPLYGLYTTAPVFDDQPRVNWRWDNSLLVEGWIVDSFSLGASYAFNTSFGFPLGDEVYTPSGRPSLRVRQFTVGRVFANWAVGRLVGLTFEVETTQTPLTSTGQVRFPFLSFGTWADNATVLWLQFWFRSDLVLQRNWIER